MQHFKDRIKNHAEHVANVGAHCSTEETTKQALILPLLDILGFNPFDPTRVKAEYGADFPGVKASERVDYALFCQGVPVMFIEAKAYNEKLSNHSAQLSRYFNATPEVAIGAVTNGREWRFFTDLGNKNMMDAEPFLSIDFTNIDDPLIPRLYRFRHDEFQPEALRMLAEETIYIASFKQVISHSLRDPDQDFIRYIANKSGVQRQLNAKFLDSLLPIVKQAVEQAVSEMVVSGLSTPKQKDEEPVSQPQAASESPFADHVDPMNPRIVTTFAERRLFELVRQILGPDIDVQSKDTESYFTVLYQGKTTRWILRYQGDKKTPCVTLPIELTNDHRTQIQKAGLQIGAADAILIGPPENLLRIAALVFESLEYSRNDDNFRRTTQGA